MTANKPIRCKAAVCKVAGQPLEMEEVEVAPPRAHEVRVRILCTSLCHTDITFWRMTCIGSTSVMAEAFQSSRMTIVLGVSNGAAPISIPSHEILRGRTITGSLFGGMKPKTDIPMLAQKYLHKELELDEFITHEIGFDEINMAFELLTQGKCLRCIVWMDGARENGVKPKENGV